MHSGPLRILEIAGDSATFGREHGKRYASDINAYLSDRLELAIDPEWAGQRLRLETVLDLANHTIPYHEAYSESLTEEMLAMAEAAGITPAEAVVVGGFTDLIDMVRGYTGAGPTMDECTAVIDPANGVLAQTWDMHASAGEFVVMLHLHPDTGPAAMVQTTAGCVGQIGMNEAGIAIGINNLTSMGRLGVTWNFVVRKVLRQTSLDKAIECVLDAELAGGHNFLLMGPDGTGANIEAMPGMVKVDRVTDAPFVHSNHCIYPETKAGEGLRYQENIVDSNRRLEVGRELAGDLDQFFSDPSISKQPKEPHLTATCGAMAMYPEKRRVDSLWGVPGEVPWESFQL